MTLRFPVRRSLCCAALAACLSSPSLHATPVTADAVVPGSYLPGNADPGYRNPATALGNLEGDTTQGGGGMNPFNATYAPSQMVIVGDGGSLTLHLSKPVPANGTNLGIYTGVGLFDVSPEGTGLTDALASSYSGQLSRSKVSVSQDGITFYALNGGAPILFNKPANYFLNAPISGYFQPIPANPDPSQIARQSKPFLGPITSLANQTYSQIKTTLNGSAGGDWLDLRGSAPVAVNYVRFDVAAGSGDRMVVDAIGALGATNTLTAGGRIISENVGTGAHTSDIVIDFGPQSYDFKVHYDGSITGEQALQLLAANSDFQFSVHTYSFGDLVSGLDYGGYVDAGLGSNGSDYWKYFTGNGATWSSSGQGAGSRLLTDGSYDGWLWGAAHAGTPNFAVVPEPTCGLAIAAVGLLLARRRK